MIFDVGVRSFPGRHIQLRNPHRICLTTQPVFQASPNQSIFCAMQHIGHNAAPVGFVPKRGQFPIEREQPPSDVIERSLDLYRDTERGRSRRRMRTLKPTEAALLLLGMSGALFRLKFFYQIVDSLLRLRIGFLSLEPHVACNSFVDLIALVAHELSPPMHNSAW